MNNVGFIFVIFLFVNLYLLEGRERGKNGFVDLDGVFFFWGSDDFDFYGVGG